MPTPNRRPVPGTTIVATAAEEHEFRQQLIKPGITYIYLSYYIIYFAFGGFYFVDFYSEVHPLLNGAQTLRLFVIVTAICSHLTLASIPQPQLLKYYNYIASLSFLFFLQVGIYTSYISRAHAAPIELYWSLTSVTIIYTIAIYGLVRLPILVTTLITSSGLAASLIYMMQSPILPSHIARFLVHISIAHVVGIFLHTSIERRERLLFFLGIENMRRSKTEKILTEHTEKTLREKLLAEEATHAKDRFLATLSHELRTPMNAITQSLAVLPGEITGISPNGQEAISVIKASSKALLGLLKELLDYANLSSGKTKIDRDQLDIRALVQEAINFFKGNAQLKNIQLILDATALPNRSVYIISDRQKILQILLNLLGNAVKFTKIGSVICKVNVLPASQDTAKLLISVTDTGIGIPTEFQPQLFTPFTQADNTDERKVGGMGLGLSITKGLVTTLSGEINYVTSEHGTTFTVILPVGIGTLDSLPSSAPGHALPNSSLPANTEQETPAEAPAQDASTTTPRKTTAAHTVKSSNDIHVLLVEDNAHSSTVTMILLQQFGFLATLAEDGQEAVACISAGEQFDVVLMDCQMPNMDGFAATRAIRKLEDAWAQQANDLQETSEAEQPTQPKRLPIIALTAYASEECQLKCKNAGMDDFLIKPIDSEQLRSSILKHAPTASTSVPQ